MSISKVFLYAEYQVSIPFGQVDWAPINAEMSKFPGLKSKTWLRALYLGNCGG